MASIGDENAVALPPNLTKGSSAMLEQRRFKRSMSFKDRLALFAQEAHEKASQMPSGPEREDMLRKARQAETASRLDACANSPGLQPPK